MLVTIGNDPEIGVSIFQFDKMAPKWVEVGRLEPGKHETRVVETGEPALIVKWRYEKGYQVVQVHVAHT